MGKQGDMMTKERKKDIDNLWINTDFGKWVLLASEGKTDEANDLFVQIGSSFPWSVDQVEQELSAKIANELDNADEFDEYLKMLDEENYDLVGFMISQDIFGKVFSLLNK